ncbi:MAG: hypothetical protein HY040_12160 [Planctomycetes bacterium]|nr:hypothetical protein [Planctomycetota bacterium]
MCIRWMMVLACGAALCLGPTVVSQDSKSAQESKEKKAAQDQKAKKESNLSLEEMLAQALKKNVDILAAQAKVRDAEIELNRVRQQVLHKIVSTVAEIQAQKALVDEYFARYQRERDLYSKGASNAADFGAAKATYEKGKADLAVIEARLPYLIGKQLPAEGVSVSTGDLALEQARSDRTVLLWESLDQAHRAAQTKPQPIQETMAEKIRAALNTEVTCDFENAELSRVLEVFAGKTKGINFQLGPKMPKDMSVTMKIAAPVPLGAAMQWFEDHYQGTRWVIRDYGIILVPSNSVPPGAILLQDFWKAPPVEGA